MTVDDCFYIASGIILKINLICYIDGPLERERPAFFVPMSNFSFRTARDFSRLRNLKKK